MWLDGIGFAQPLEDPDQVADRRQGRLRRDAGGPEAAGVRAVRRRRGHLRGTARRRARRGSTCSGRRTRRTRRGCCRPRPARRCAPRRTRRRHGGRLQGAEGLGRLHADVGADRAARAAGDRAGHRVPRHVRRRADQHDQRRRPGDRAEEGDGGVQPVLDKSEKGLSLAIDLLVVLEMPQYSRDHLAEAYTVHYWPDPAEHARLLQTPVARKIRAVQTNGSFGLPRRYIEALPALEIICAIGAGFESIDVEAARAHGIVVTHGAGADAPTVAEQAWALLLGAARRVPWCDRSVREGRWDDARKIMASVTGENFGIFGLGHVGMAIARRGLGFDMEVGYCSRKARADVAYRYFDRLIDLAGWCDVLMIAAPGGPETRHAVNREVLAALGPDGFLVNAARGSLVDSAALAEALRDGRIAGAGLDVIEGEPVGPGGIPATRPAGDVAARWRILARGGQGHDSQAAQEPRRAFRRPSGIVPDTRVALRCRSSRAQCTIQGSKNDVRDSR